MSTTAPYVPLRPLRLNGPVYGFILALATLAVVILVAHHPVANLHDRAEGLNNIIAMTAADQWVHGALMAVEVLFAVGFSGFAWRLGIDHPAVMAGWLCYLLGCVCLILAMLFDGFIVPDLARTFAANVSAHPTAYDLITFCGLLIQGLTKLGFVMAGVAFVMWAHALAHHKGGARIIAAVAMLTGGLSAAYVLSSQAGFNPRTLFWFFVAQVGWNLTVAFWMIRGLKRPAP